MESKKAALPRSWRSLLSPYVLDADSPRDQFEQLVRVGGILLISAGILGVSVSFLPGASVYLNENGVGLIGLAAIMSGLGLVSAPQLFTPWLLYLVMAGASIAISVGAYYAGDRRGYGAMLYSWATTIAFVGLRRRWAIGLVALVGFCYAVVLVLHDTGTAGWNDWSFTVGTLVVIGSIIARLVQHSHGLAVAEHEARAEAEAARARFAALNQELEARVRAQVEEVERLGKLRRLLSPQLAEAVLTSDDALEPHRRDLAVVFVDIRGFTQFASGAEPEEVRDVLEGFYSTLGAVFDKYEATVGAFQGDGVMAYFNDPVPVPDPAARAVEMVLDLAPDLDRLFGRWGARGFELGYGIGIAHGYATVGMVGFEGRQDYTAVGTVVNLAARLCDEAAAGETLVDRRTASAVSGVVELIPVEPLRLKGFRDPVPAYRVGGAKPGREGMRLVVG